MEMSILQWFQSLHTPALDQIMIKVFNDFVGKQGEMWILLGVLCLIFPRTRKAGVCVLSAYIISYYAGDLLKELFARPRPFIADPSVNVIINKSSSYSCPSVHSMLAFGSASAVFWFNKKAGVIALIFAALVALSRLYFFVHYPTDVLLGAALGFIIGTLICKLFKRADEKKQMSL